MKIALVCQYPFLNPTKGVEVRLNQTASFLAELGNVWPLIVTRLQTSESRVEDLRQKFGRVSHIMPTEPPSRSAFARLGRMFQSEDIEGRGFHVAKHHISQLIPELRTCDVVWFHSLKVADSLGFYRWTHGILDLDDLHSEKHYQAARLSSTLRGKLTARWRALLWSSWERDSVKRFQRVLVCSDDDKNLMGNHPRIVSVPNAIDDGLETTNERIPCPDRIGFLGTLDYYANQDAVNWFSTEVLPLILKQRPTLRFRVAGFVPTTFRRPASANVDLLGYVPDLDKELASWTASVVPMRIGGGTRLKILDSFRRRCPVISTTLGAYGLGVNNDVDILTANDKHSFASACLRLCSHPEVGHRLGEAGHRLLQRRFTRAAVRPIVHEMVRTIAALPRP